LGYSQVTRRSLQDAHLEREPVFLRSHHGHAAFRGYGGRTSGAMHDTVSNNQGDSLATAG